MWSPLNDVGHAHRWAIRLRCGRPGLKDRCRQWDPLPGVGAGPPKLRNGHGKLAKITTHRCAPLRADSRDYPARFLINQKRLRTFCHLYLAKVRVHHLGHARSGGTAGLENQNDFTRSMQSRCRSEGSSARAVSYGGRPPRRTITNCCQTCGGAVSQPLFPRSVLSPCCRPPQVRTSAGLVVSTRCRAVHWMTPVGRCLNRELLSVVDTDAPNGARRKTRYAPRAM